jgi:hypothetical protein
MKFYKNFLVYWCAFYLLIAFVGRFTAIHKEYFPFFRWSLYSKTPNTIKQAYVLVEKIGDSTLPELTDLRKLTNYHHINPVDVNLIVRDFYDQYNNGNLDKNQNLFKIFPKESVFYLYESTMDLSIEDYEKSRISKRLLTHINEDYNFE